MYHERTYVFMSIWFFYIYIKYITLDNTCLDLEIYNVTTIVRCADAGPGVVRAGVGHVAGVARAALAARRPGAGAAARPRAQRPPAPVAAAPGALPPAAREGQPAHGGEYVASSADRRLRVEWLTLRRCDCAGGGGGPAAQRAGGGVGERRAGGAAAGGGNFGAVLRPRGAPAPSRTQHGHHHHTAQVATSSDLYAVHVVLIIDEVRLFQLIKLVLVSSKFPPVPCWTTLKTWEFTGILDFNIKVMTLTNKEFKIYKLKTYVHFFILFLKIISIIFSTTASKLTSVVKNEFIITVPQFPPTWQRECAAAGRVQERPPRGSVTVSWSPGELRGALTNKDWMCRVQLTRDIDVHRKMNTI